MELTLKLKESGRFLPGRLVLFSPWTDLTASGESYQSARDLDPMLTMNYIQAVRSAYAPQTDWADPHLSPLFAELPGFPPTLIHVGEREILRDASTALAQKLRAAEVPCVIRTWPDMWHVFQMFPLKSASEAMEHVADFLQRYD